MKLNKIILIGDLVERLSEYTDTDILDIVDALTGLCWDEEDAGNIRYYHTNEDDI